MLWWLSEDGVLINLSRFYRLEFLPSRYGHWRLVGRFAPNDVREYVLVDCIPEEKVSELRESLRKQLRQAGLLIDCGKEA